jgi:S-adenosylmethionine decarboxylase
LRQKLSRQQITSKAKSSHIGTFRAKKNLALGGTMHLIIDGYGDNPKLMQDEQFLYQLLDSYPAQIGMTKISSPLVFRYVGSRPEDWGISGFVFIAESHISIHTFVERRYINIDVFSCKDFNAEQVIKDLKDKFQLTRFSSRLINRDWKMADLAEATDIPQFRSV